MSQFKKKVTAFSAMLAFLTFSSAPSLALSTSDVLGTTNNVGVTGGNNRIDVGMLNNAGSGAVGQVDWQNFNLGSKEHLNFGFSGISQTIINRVLGGQESKIFGKITNSSCVNAACNYESTGKVVLINPAGVMFGPGSTVDLNSFTTSTFDFKGAKNLKDMSEAELSAYMAGTLGKINAYSGDGKITYDSNYIEAFEKAGIDMSKFTGKTQVILGGTTFDRLNEDGSASSYNNNQSIAIVSDNIRYKDSLLKTGENLNYESGAGNLYSLSKLRLVTADGVTFRYLNTGLANEMSIADDTKTDVVRNIGGLTSEDENRIASAAKEFGANKALSDNASTLSSGHIDIVNMSNAKNSNIKLANTFIRGTKLINTQDGNIEIVGNHDVSIDNSRLETFNSTYYKDGSKYDGVNTFNQAGGQINITAGQNINIKNSIAKTADAIKKDVDVTGSGDITLNSVNGKTEIDNTMLVSTGDVTSNSATGFNANNSFIKADGSNMDKTQNINIISEGDINTHNLVTKARNNITFKSAINDNLSGNINISGDVDETNGNQSLIRANGKLSIQGKNTKIDNATLAYKEITFYNDGTQGTNNVTVANNAQFAPLVTKDGKISLSNDINLETNGDFTLDNAKVQVGGHSLKYSNTSNQESYKVVTQGHDADNINIKSTNGNVIAKNNTNVNANKNITLTSDKGNININKSNFKTNEENINIIASKGSVNIKDNSGANAGKDLNIKADKTITFGAQGASNINIDNSSNLVAGNNMNVISLSGDINAEKTTMPTLSYGNRLTFDAAKNNNFTSENSLKAVNVDFIAGGENNFTTKGDIQFVNSLLKAPKNNITTTQEGGDVIMNDLTIKQATANAKDTVTKISAKGNVTTKDVTGTAKADKEANVKTFPQSVDFDGVVTDKTVNDTTLDINQTKLVINTNVTKTTPKNNDQGSITINVKNANNRDAGLELVAENDSWDAQIDKGEGPEVHLKSVDGTVSITNIDTDKLTLVKGDNYLSASDAPNGMATIRVKDQGGFNLDPNVEYDPAPDGFTYDKTINSTDTSKVTERIWDEEKGEYIISQDDKETVFGKDYVDKTTITTRDTEHEIHFDQNGDEHFKLIYDKTDVKVTEEPGTVTRKETCEPTPDPNITTADSYVNIIRLPREQVEISKTSKVSDNTVDQTSSVMSAAAKVDLNQAAEASYVNNDADEDEDK